MADKKNEDPLLMGQVLSKEAPDSDGDGVSDIEEELADDLGHPQIRRPKDEDPRGDIGRPRELDVEFDPTANLPAGQTITGGLAGLTNLDGTALSTAVSHDGMALPGGHGGSVNPRDLGAHPNSGGGGAQPEFRPNNNMDLVSSKSGGGKNGPRDDMFNKGVNDMEAGNNAMDAAKKAGEASMATDAALKEQLNAPTPSAQAAANKEYQKAADAEAQARADAAEAQAEADKAAKELAEARAKAKAEADAQKKKEEEEDDEGYDNPDADDSTTDRPPTEEEMEGAIAKQGWNTKPIGEGGSTPPLTAPPPGDPYDPIINKGDGSSGGDLGSFTPMTGAPDAPVIHTVNPDSGFGGVRPTGGAQPTGGGGDKGGGGNTGGGDTGQIAGSAAAMASVSGDSGSEMSAAGSGGGGIQSVADEAPPTETPAAAEAPAATEAPAAAADVTGLADTSVSPGDASHVRDAGDAVEAFASEYMEETLTPAGADAGIIIPDVGRAAAAPELEVATGPSPLEADLGEDLVQVDQLRGDTGLDIQPIEDAPPSFEDEDADGGDLGG